MQHYVDYRSMQLRMKRHIVKFAKHGEYQKYNDYMRECENCRNVYKLNEMMKNICTELNRLEDK